MSDPLKTTQTYWNIYIFSIIIFAKKEKRWRRKNGDYKQSSLRVVIRSVDAFVLKTVPLICFCAVYYETWETQQSTKTAMRKQRTKSLFINSSDHPVALCDCLIQ